MTKYPAAVTHGMGDSCFNAGMKQITALIGNVSHQSVLPRTLLLLKSPLDFVHFAGEVGAETEPSWKVIGHRHRCLVMLGLVTKGTSHATTA